MHAAVLIFNPQQSPILWRELELTMAGAAGSGIHTLDTFAPVAFELNILPLSQAVHIDDPV